MQLNAIVMTTEAQLSKTSPLPGPRNRTFSLLKPSQMGSLSNSRCLNRKDRPNRSTDNENVVDKA